MDVTLFARADEDLPKYIPREERSFLSHSAWHRQSKQKAEICLTHWHSLTAAKRNQMAIVMAYLYTCMHYFVRKCYDDIDTFYEYYVTHS
jgi:uncharacterized protein HemY